MRHLTLGLALLPVLNTASVAVHADEIKPMEGKLIEMGDVHGVACYTADPDGCHLVVTFTQGANGQPIRFVTVLRPNQSTIMEVARGINRRRFRSNPAGSATACS